MLLEVYIFIIIIYIIILYIRCYISKDYIKIWKTAISWGKNVNILSFLLFNPNADECSMVFKSMDFFIKLGLGFFS